MARPRPEARRGTSSKLIMMCEIPSNVHPGRRASLEFFDGFSIGSNDLTQLTLGAGP
jgi:phosphoenolpyruvate synthase/pyruvate phosphate dikinase